MMSKSKGSQIHTKVKGHSTIILYNIQSQKNSSNKTVLLLQTQLNIVQDSELQVETCKGKLHQLKRQHATAAVTIPVKMVFAKESLHAWPTFCHIGGWGARFCSTKRAAAHA